MSEDFKGFDFGFSLVTEDELDAVQDAQQQTTSAVAASEESLEVQSELRWKVDTMYQMIQPLLMNLAQDPEKKYILWPERVSKVSEFKEMVDKVYMR